MKLVFPYLSNIFSVLMLALMFFVEFSLSFVVLIIMNTKPGFWFGRSYC